MGSLTSLTPMGPGEDAESKTKSGYLDSLSLATQDPLYLVPKAHTNDPAYLDRAPRLLRKCIDVYWEDTQFEMDKNQNIHTYPDDVPQEAVYRLIACISPEETPYLPLYDVRVKQGVDPTRKNLTSEDLETQRIEWTLDALWELRDLSNTLGVCHPTNLAMERMLSQARKQKPDVFPSTGKAFDVLDISVQRFNDIADNDEHWFRFFVRAFTQRGEEGWKRLEREGLTTWNPKTWQEMLKYYMCETSGVKLPGEGK
ncbi:hypothetical protein K491DRAFT_680937 [Lophiostoma macrostomum CBS 122681]|uniref:Uncharacterized protein n=1 Tax=Lophiostoma macrostomum CBS 122681 TaxID=1314788 RepID=A0A6A6SZE9_9PLEO|nr:hypothetical protein K491DRAFT_680937 [Lophiostoma macrostomum CBS 122681]